MTRGSIELDGCPLYRLDECPWNDCRWGELICVDDPALPDGWWTQAKTDGGFTLLLRGGGLVVANDVYARIGFVGGDMAERLGQHYVDVALGKAVLA